MGNGGALSEGVLTKIIFSYSYVAIWVFLSFTVIVYNKCILDRKIHMAFCSSLAYILVSVLKVVEPVQMTRDVYLKSVVPIGTTYVPIDIKSNIVYGCSRDINQEDMESAARQAYTFISALLNGYETIVDDGLLSRGQKQRIAIARSILRDPAIMILDEPTSALDSESELIIQELMLRLKTNTKVKRSILFIAHRLSTARSADRIVIMDGGRVVQIPITCSLFT